MDRRAARAGGDARLAQHRQRRALSQRRFEGAQLCVDPAKRRELRLHDVVVALPKAVQVEDEPAKVAVGELARRAQEAGAAADVPARKEARLRWGLWR
jgi:hypothetical protein